MVENECMRFMPTLQSVVPTSRNLFLSMQNERYTKFHILHPLTDEVAMQS